MKVLLVSTHPCEESFNNYLAARAVEVLGRRHDLLYVDINHDSRDGLLAWAEAVVWVYPTWWSSPPARLLEWLYDHFTGPYDRLTKMAVVTTHGSSWRVNKLAGEVGRRLMTKRLPSLANPTCRCRWIALYDIDRATADRRTRFVESVEKELAAL